MRSTFWGGFKQNEAIEESSAKPSFQTIKKFKNKVDIENKRCKMRTSLEQGEQGKRINWE